MSLNDRGFSNLINYHVKKLETPKRCSDSFQD